MNTHVKDPNSVLDFSLDWSVWLQDSETITTSVWLPDEGITTATPSVVGERTVVWLSGGEVGQTYRVTNRITTSAGRIDDRTLLVRIRER